MQSIYSLLIVIVGFLTLYIIGLPVTHIVIQFSSTKAIHQKDTLWALAPFVGYSIIATVFKLLIRIDVIINRTASYLFLAVFIVIIIIWFLHNKIKNNNFKNFLYTMTPTKWFVLFLVLTILLAGVAYIIVGPTYYRGYGQWDNIYYGTNAETLRNVPLSTIGEQFEHNPYMQVTDWGNAVGRADISVVTAFIASICNIDGASLIGFISVLGTMLCFCSLVFLTKNFDIKPSRKIALCFFGATLPGPLIVCMESFIAANISMAFAFLFCRLFYVTLKSPNIPKTILCAVIFSQTVTMYDAGFFIAIAIMFVTILYCIVFEKLKLQQLLPILAIGGISIIFNIPYLSFYQRALRVVGGNVHNLGKLLNIHYPFAYTPSGLTWTFFGDTFEGSSSGISLFINAIVILLFIITFVGIINEWISGFKPEITTMLAYMAFPFVFLCFNNGHEYAYFKMFTMIAPLYVFAVYFGFRLIGNNLQKNIFLQYNNTTLQWVRKNVLKIGTIGFFFIFIISSLFAFCRTMLIPVVSSLPNSIITRYRLEELSYFFNEEHIELYDMIAEKHDQDILLLGHLSNAEYYWAVYHGRDNNFFGITDLLDDSFSNGRRKTF